MKALGIAFLVVGLIAVELLILIGLHLRNIDRNLNRQDAASVPVSAAQPRPAVRPTAESTDAGNGCGVERAAVKHLTDRYVLGRPHADTIDHLIQLDPPPVTPSSPRFTNWTGPHRLPEGRLTQLTAVHVVAAKQEPDSDLHVIVEGDYSHAQMNVELPMAACEWQSRYVDRLTAARRNADAKLGHVSASHYTSEDVWATIRGPIFYDVLHGQRGAANGVELHPVTMFRVVGAVK